MSQYHFTPEGYLDMIRSEVGAYDDLQDRVAESARGLAGVHRILELGTGTGETSRRVLEDYPIALLVGVDVSEEMLIRARDVLPMKRVEGLLVQDIADPLPEGPFDLVISALAVHHLEGEKKLDLFRRIAARLRPGGRFVMGDVIKPVTPADAAAPITEGYDFPSPIDDLLRWLGEAGFSASTAWTHKDLAVIAANRSSSD